MKFFHRSSPTRWGGLYARLLDATAPALLAVALACAPAARAIEITLPAEKLRLADSPLPGAALATAMCYTCHSAEYSLYQPPTSPRT